MSVIVVVGTNGNLMYGLSLSVLSKYIDADGGGVARQLPLVLQNRTCNGLPTQELPLLFFR